MYRCYREKWTNETEFAIRDSALFGHHFGKKKLNLVDEYLEPDFAGYPVLQGVHRHLVLSKRRKFMAIQKKPKTTQMHVFVLYEWRTTFLSSFGHLKNRLLD